MQNSEFLLFIPGVIYGVGVVDLLKIFRNKMYWEIIAWGIVLFLILIVQWFTLFERLSAIEMDIGLFTLLLLGPLAYTMTCTILTPEEDDRADTRAYFFKVRRKFFSWIIGFIMVNTFLQFIISDDGLAFLRLVLLPFLIGCVVINNIWMRTIALILVFGALFSIYMR